MPSREPHEGGNGRVELELTPALVRRVLVIAAGEGRTDGGRAGRRGLDRNAAEAAARQRRVALLLRGGGPATPATLRVRLGLLDPPVRPPRRFGPVPLRGPAPRSLVVGVASVAVALIGVLLVGGSTSSLPAAVQVASLWRLPVTRAGVTSSPRDPRELDVNFNGTQFPNYRDGEGWHAVGTRAGKVAGRPAFTVYYETGARRAAYTVLAATRVSIPAGSNRFVAGGRQLAEFRSGDHWVVVFHDLDNSCVLTAAAPREKRWLVKLAVWQVSGGSHVYGGTAAS